MLKAADDETAGLEILRALPPEGVEQRETPLLFLHGAFAGAWCWTEHFLSWFAAQGYACYAPSFRGHAGSAGHDRLHEFGIDDYVVDVFSTVEELPTKPVIIGHSMGGFVAMRYLESGPAMGLVLMASVPPNGLAGPASSLAMWNPSLLGEIALLQQMDPKWSSLSVMQDVMFSANDDPEAIARHFDQMDGESRRATLDMHGMMRLNPDSWKATMPTMVIGASEDTLIRKAFVRSTARRLGQRATFVDGIGHGMMLGRNWGDVAVRICGWLRDQGF